eukprot:Selendium_serpulae@DN2041_c0_g1_i1.p1
MHSKMHSTMQPPITFRSPRGYGPSRLERDSMPAHVPAALLAGEAADMTPDEYRTAWRNLSLLKEYEYVQQQAPQGLYILPSWEDLSVWYGVIFVRQGFYSSGIYKFRLDIPEKYPEAAPIVTFTQPVHHPLIHAETGQLDLRSEFEEWTVEHNLVFVLIFIKRIFYNKKLFVAYEDPPDHAAYEEFVNNKRAFMENAEEAAKETNKKTSKYAVDAKSSLQFFEPTEKTKKAYKQIRQQIHHFAEDDPTRNRRTAPAQAKEAFLNWLETDFIPQEFAEASDDNASDTGSD